MISEAPESVYLLFVDGFVIYDSNVRERDDQSEYRLASSVEREIAHWKQARQDALAAGDVLKATLAERDAEIARLRNALKLLGEGSTARMVTKGRLEVWELMAQYAREVLEGK